MQKHDHMDDQGFVFVDTSKRVIKGWINQSLKSLNAHNSPDSVQGTGKALTILSSPNDSTTVSADDSLRHETNREEVQANSDVNSTLFNQK